MANIFQKIIGKISGIPNNENSFNQAFLRWIGSGFTKYDANNPTYLERGYNQNPDVYAVINKKTVKLTSVPYTIKKIDDTVSYGKLRELELATKGDFSLLQMVKHRALQKKAYSSKDTPFPLKQPNPTQTWSDIWGLYETYMDITGNFYMYSMSTKDGANKGVPMLTYALPAHLMQIVLKPNAGMLTMENPIDYYMLIEGNQYIRFEADDVIHVKYPNPNFDLQGSHLYGQSPLRAALRNINSQNSAIDTNIKTLQSAGAFGFIYGKGVPWTADQAASMKERLQEMDASPERLSKIAGASGEVGFQRISLTTDELKPFDYLTWDRDTICNVLNFPSKLLNKDTSGALSNNDNADARKQLITDAIKPNLCLLQDALNKSYIPRFKGYENSVIEWDVTELPEMQVDMKTQAEALNLIPVTPNEKRVVFGYETLKEDGMDVVWMPTNTQRIDDVSAGVIDNAILNQ